MQDHLIRYEKYVFLLILAQCNRNGHFGVFLSTNTSDHLGVQKANLFILIVLFITLGCSKP